jgi:hypothetical protein
MQMKRILGILLALCFLMSVTVAAVSAEPMNRDDNKDKKMDKDDNKDKRMDKDDNKDKRMDKDDNKDKRMDKDDNKKFDMKHTKGHWMFKKTRHDKDKNHRFIWFTNDRYWQWDN